MAGWKLHGSPCAHRLGGPFRVDEPDPLGSVLLGQKAVHGNVSPVRVSHVGLAVGEGQFLGLDHQVDALGRVAPQGLEVELLHDVQFLQQYVAAGVGWRLVDRVAVVGGGDGRLPTRSAVCQVLQRQNPALFLAESDNGPGRFSLVKRVAPAVDYGLESVGQPRLPQVLPRLHGHPGRGENGLRVGELAQQAVARNDARQHVSHRKAVFRQVDGRIEHLASRQRAVALVGGHPGVHQPRHRDRQDALGGDAVPAVPIDVGGVGSGAGAVAHLDGARLPVVDHDEPVAADARHVRLDDVQRGGRGDGSIDGVAAPLQHGHPGLRRQRVPGSNHPVPPHDHRPVGLEVDAVRCVRHRGASLLRLRL